MEKPVHFWKLEYRMPVLWVDPMPQLGYYMNQRAMFKHGFPRPVKWMPINWITVPIILVISFAAYAREALRDASNQDRGDG